MLLAQEGRPSAQPQLGRQQQQQQQQQQQNQQQQQLQQQTRLVAARALPPQPQGSVAGDASVGGWGARLTGVAGMTTSSHLVGCFASQVISFVSFIDRRCLQARQQQNVGGTCTRSEC